MCDHRHDVPRTERSRSRRHVLTASGVAIAAALGGCTGNGPEESEPPDAVSLAGGLECDVCGMVVEEHQGPNGQIFYADDSPETHDNPARFESLRACMFPYHFEKQQFDWEVAAAYATDYSAVDYEITTESGDAYIQSFTGTETFADVEELTFVVGSDVNGSMGREFVPFSGDDDVDSFVEEHGGERYDFEDITPDMLSR